MQMGDGESLLVKTLKRAQAVAVGEEVITVTARDHFFITRDEYRGLLADADARFLLEPVGRNTAPALAMAALDIEHRHGPDAQMLVLPADHLIRDLDSYAQAVRQARELAAQGYLVTFGIVPNRPETGFGYIRAGASLAHGRDIEAFVEKPDAETAAAYVASGDYLWNSGMFCFAAGALLESMAQTCPALLAAARECYARVDSDAMPIEFERDSFAALPDISVDYAVMEKAERRAVIPASFDWNDIGSWKAISDLDPGDDAGNRTVGPAVLVDTRNCYVQSKGRLVAAVGVDDLVIVDTGDAVLGEHPQQGAGGQAGGRRTALAAQRSGQCAFHRASPVGQLFGDRGRAGLQGQAPDGQAGAGTFAADALSSERALDGRRGHREACASASANLC